MSSGGDDDPPSLQAVGSDACSQSENEETDSDGSLGQDREERDTGTESESDNEIPKLNNSRKPPSSEWIEFNKKVVSMRPLFKSAKVQFIHKVTRTIKTMRTKKGTSEQIERNQRKADRLVQEIAYINRLKKDVIAKFALLHSKEEVAKVVNSPDSTMEYRVKAKVAAMPMISKVADAYHAQNPNWRETLFKLIQLAGKNMKKKRRKLRGKTKQSSNKPDEVNSVKKPPTQKPRKINQDYDDSGRFNSSNFPEPPPGVDDLLQQSGGSDEENSDDDTGSITSSDDELSSEKQGAILKIVNNKKNETLPPSSQGQQRESQRKVKPSLEKKQTNLTLKDEHKTGPGGKFERKTQFSKSLMNEKSLELKSSTFEPSDNEASSESDEIDLSNVDPFFMTSDNKEYKSLWKVEPADSFKNKNKNEPEFMFKNARTYNDLKRGKSDMGGMRTKAPRLSRKDKKALGEGAQSKPSLESLHPSWQAKKKLCTSGVSFQGKKIVFDDD